MDLEIIKEVWPSTQNPANTNTNIPQSGQVTGQQAKVPTLADLITQQQPARKR